MRLRSVLALLLLAGCATSGHQKKYGWGGGGSSSGGGGTVTADSPLSGDGSSGNHLVISAIPNSKLATMANATFKCRNTAGTGAPEDCTATQVNALLSTTPYTPAAKALARCQTLLGTTMTAVNGTDFGGGDAFLKTLIQGTATTATLRTDITGGVMRIATTAANTNGAWVNPVSTVWTTTPTSSSTSGSLVGNPRTEKWCMIARFQIEDLPTVVSHEEAAISMGKAANSPNIKFGAPNRQTADITHFSWTVDDHTGAVTASGSTSIALDTSWHTLEMWNDTTNLNFGIDLGSSVTPTATTASTNIDTTDGMTWNIITFQDGSGSGAQRRSSTDSIYVVTANQ